MSAGIGGGVGHGGCPTPPVGTFASFKIGGCEETGDTRLRFGDLTLQ